MADTDPIKRAQALITELNKAYQVCKQATADDVRFQEQLDNILRFLSKAETVEHARITVAAPIPVTGESALAGIYYSLEANGVQLPQENKDLAQEELKALSDINDENKDKSGYDANKLNVALADIKSAIAKAKESKGELTEDDVRKIVEDTLKNYKLDQVVTGNQINVIINFAFNLSKSDILNNEDFTKTLKDLKQSIVAQAGDSFSNIDLNFDANKAFEDGGNILSAIWQAIVNFFKSFGA